MQSNDPRTLLRQLDDPVHSEAPPGWDRGLAEARFLELVRELECRLGRRLECETGALIQDASFHGQILLPHEVLTGDFVVPLRASNFDRLATILDAGLVQPQALAAILETLEEQGFTYVPSDLLHAPYDGANSGVDGISTWAQRYFDWI